MWGADRKICPRVTVCDAKQWSWGTVFSSAPNNHDRLFFLHTIWPAVFDFSIGVAINESRSYTLTSAILEVDVVYDATMTSTPNVLMTELRDLLYNQCIAGLHVLVFDFYLSHGSEKGM